MPSNRFNSKKRKRLKKAHYKRQKKDSLPKLIARNINFVDLREYYMALSNDERDILDYKIHSKTELYRLSQENGYIVKQIHAWQLGKRLSSWWLVEWVGYDGEYYWEPDFNVKGATDCIDDFLATSFCDSSRIKKYWNKNK